MRRWLYKLENTHLVVWLFAMHYTKWTKIGDRWVRTRGVAKLRFEGDDT